MGGLSHHTLTPFLLKAEIKLVKGIKVRDFHSSFTLINEYTEPRVAQVQVVFQIPNVAISKVFPSPQTKVLSHLAYVEWFLLDSGTPGKPEAESDKASGSAGGRIACSAIVGRPDASGAGRTPVHSGAHT